MKKCLVLFAMLLSAAAWGDYDWPFARNLEGWVAEDGLAWGVKGAGLAWEPLGEGDGMAVFRCDGGGYPEGFEGRMHLFYWNSTAWNDYAPGVNGGPTGRYCILRCRITGTQPVPADPHWGKLEYLVSRYAAGVSLTQRAWGRPLLGAEGERSVGAWTTLVIDQDKSLADPVERVQVQVGTTARGAMAFFPSAEDRIEIDWVRTVDDPRPYLAETFDDGAPSQWRAGPGAFAEVSLADGALQCVYPTDVSGAAAPVLENDQFTLRAHDGDGLVSGGAGVYLNVGYRLACPGGCTLDTFPARAAWSDSNAADPADSVTLALPVGGPHVASFALHEAPGWAAGDLWDYQTGGWRLYFGQDPATGRPLADLAGATLYIDWIAFATAAGETPPIVLPDLRGWGEAAAQTALTALGLAAGETQAQHSVQAEAGSVFRTEPAAGSWVRAGDTVALVVSAGSLPEVERTVPGVPTVLEDGTLARDGAPLRAQGMNFFSAFSRTLADPADTSYEEGFAALSASGVPFVRFMCGGFWPVNMQRYQRDRAGYFELLDRFVAAAEAHRVGLIPSVCWFDAMVPDLVGEPRGAWGDPDSATVAFMRNYTEELVTRYRTSPAVWAWELGNEYNLSADLPNASTHRPPIVPSLGTPETRSEADDMTHEMWLVAYEQFGRVIRAFDATRPITTGNSAPRPSQYHQRIELSWTQDTREQYQQNLVDVTPDPLDLVSIHLYPASESSRFDEGVQPLGHLLDLSAAAAHGSGRALFLGEWGFSAEDFGGDAGVLEQRFYEALDDIAASGTDLAALWVFDLPMQGNTHDISPTNERVWMVDAVGAANDTDNDGLDNLAELRDHETDPYDADTDGGGVDDGTELARGTDPLNPADDVRHSADTDLDGSLSLSELLRVVQIYRAGDYHCAPGTADGYAPGPGDAACARHHADYADPAWQVGLSEMLRACQVHAAGAYHHCPGAGTDDGFCIGPP